VYLSYLLCAFLLLAPPTSRSQSLPDLGDIAQSEFSLSEERRLGENIMRELRADRSYSEDAEVVDYLNALGNRLVSVNRGSPYQFYFFLVDDPQVNAFALPGGFIGINSGLLVAAQTESELAGVLAHEIAHITQRHIARIISAQKQAQVLSLAGLALAILAARANSDLGQAALLGSQAAYIQTALNFTRDHEREADRFGLQTLEQAGFDPQGMATFFERLQRSTRFSESNAPSYLRTHPLTFERIADMQNRMREAPYKQVQDSPEFQLMRAKIKAAQGNPQQSVLFFEESLKERRYMSEAASRYGLVFALMRAKSYKRAIQELVALRKLVSAHPIVEALAAALYSNAGDDALALQTYRDAHKKHPGYRAIVYGYAEALLRARQPAEALKLVETRLQHAGADYRLHQLRAQAYAALQKPLEQHRALAEAYYQRGNLGAAIEQLILAQRSGGDFYQQSSVDARLRQLRVLEQEERKAARK
jgi:predicted Zn-dependent protease